MDSNVIVITGSNSGVGLSLAKRLAQDAVTSRTAVTLCLACRNPSRATKARDEVLEETQQFVQSQGTGAELSNLVQVDIVLVDTSNLASVARAANELMTKYRVIDRLVLNAGILPMTGVNLAGIPDFLSDISVGGCSTLGKQTDVTLPNGLKSIFCTNALGHHCLIELLKDHLAEQSRPCRIIWSSSRSARKRHFNLKDIQALVAIDPYSSSKFCCDALSVAWHERFSSSNGNVTSFSSCPGLAMTSLTAAILPQFVWFFIIPILYLLKLFTTMMTVTLWAGAEATFYLCKTPNVNTLDHRSKYVSEGRIGPCTVGMEKMPISSQEALQVFNAIASLVKEHHADLALSNHNGNGVRCK
eukprot:scpid85639/ scgid12494/ 3-keto-steroid reductase; 17-beta-hydroxysteroid dehydrogenase 7; Estradiol 17-beta-dehydrogenase 7; PRL receptor-associated protein